jgi:hypothetical protein
MFSVVLIILIVSHYSDFLIQLFFLCSQAIVFISLLNLCFHCFLRLFFHSFTVIMSSLIRFSLVSFILLFIALLLLLLLSLIFLLSLFPFSASLDSHTLLLFSPCFHSAIICIPLFCCRFYFIILTLIFSPFSGIVFSTLDLTVLFFSTILLVCY